MYMRLNITQALGVCIALLCYAPIIHSQDLSTAPVQRLQRPELRVIDATIEAVQQATVSAQTSGRIMEITVDVDDYVPKGTVIIRLRDKEQRAAFNAAKARFEEAEAEYKRVKEIYGRKLVAKAALDKAEAQLKATRAAMEQAQEALEHTLVRAPYSGIVVKRHVEVGETARVGQALMTGLSLEKLRATVDLPQSLIHAVRKHQKAWVWVGKDKNRKVEAASLTISPFADSASHTFLVRVNLSASDLDIYPGMHTKVAFLVGETSSLAIPASAVVRRSEVTGVYVVDNNQRLQFRQVRVGAKLDDGLIEVLAGLNQSENIMLDPVSATNLRDTQKQTGIDKD
jgi:RND family efflux transporter MFP subunit